MSAPARWLRWLAPLALLALVAAIGADSAARGLAATSPLVRFGLVLYLLASLAASLDLLDMLLRIHFRRLHTVPTREGRVSPTSVPLLVGRFTPYQMRLHLRPYAVLVSVHDLGEGVDEFLAGLGPLRPHTWVIDDASSDDTWDRLLRSGVRCVRGEVNRRKPGAIRELLHRLPPDVATVVVLDPDVRVDLGGEGGILDLERVLFEFQRSRMAALCPRIVVRPDGWLVGFQELEYAQAMALGRKSMADHSITSGVAVYRREALERLLDTHSLSVYAEDLRNAILLLAGGERIYYDGRLVVQTEGKRTLGAWFSQRVGWFYGLVRVYSEHLPALAQVTRRRLVFFYQFAIYLGLFGILLHPLKLWGLAIMALSAVNGVDNLLRLGLVPESSWTHPLYFVLVYVKYLVVAGLGLHLGVERGQRARLLWVVPTYFLYALVHLLPITVGYLNWVALRLLGRRLYRDHYQDEERLKEEQNGRRKAG